MSNKVVWDGERFSILPEDEANDGITKRRLQDARKESGMTLATKEELEKRARRLRRKNRKERARLLQEEGRSQEYIDRMMRADE